ncbi:hypothetical protein PDIDSM_3737 [Penicillium digitatum]|nr:hypothetical protein PDIDSM_3737 [Penicillium digitatum]
MATSSGLTIVIKLGTSSIVDEKTHEPILSILTLIVETVTKLHRDGHRVVLVSSGAVGVGLRRMNVDNRPTYLPRIQALAAVGQCRLMSLWDNLFSHLRVPVAQILLTRNDIADRTQYVNAQNTFGQLFDMGVIPIVNENDTLAVSEIKFGDNEPFSAISRPRTAWNQCCVTTVITKSSKPGSRHCEIPQYLEARSNGVAADDQTAPNHGLAHELSGYSMDSYHALLNNANLLPAGVVGVEGHFGQQESVRLVVVDRPSPDALDGDFIHHREEPKEVGRALVNYGSIEIAHIKGHRSTQIETLLGYADSDYVAMRENISFHPEDHSRTVTPSLTPALEEWKSP